MTSHDKDQPPAPAASKPRREWYAHSEGRDGTKQLLRDHLRQTAELASRFAAPLGPDAQKEAFTAAIADSYR